MKIVLPDDFHLPKISTIYNDCLRMLNSSDIDVNLLIKEVVQDIELSSNILKLANSNLFLLGQGVSTNDLKTAIFRIGYENLRQLIILHILENSFSLNDSINFFEFKSYIKHSSFVSLLCIEFAKKIAPNNIAEIQVAGLMHDLGLIVMACHLNSNFKLLVNYCIKKNVDFAVAEHQLGIMSHAKIAYQVLNFWDIPENIKLLVSNHDTFNLNDRKNIKTETNILVDIIVLSDLLAHSYGFGFKDYKRDTKIDSLMLKRMMLTSDIVKEVVKNALETESAILNNI